MEVQKEDNETSLDVTVPLQNEHKQMDTDTKEVHINDEGIGDVEKEDAIHKSEEGDKKVEGAVEETEKDAKKENELEAGKEGDESDKEGRKEVEDEDMENTKKKDEDGTNREGNEKPNKEGIKGVQGEADAKVERLAKAGIITKGPTVSKVRQVETEIHSEESESTLQAPKKVKAEEGEEVISGKESELLDENSEEELGESSEEDPSFLREFFTSEEELSSASKMAIMKGMGDTHEESEDEDDQPEVYVKLPDKELSDRVYDEICETPLSTDESFSIPKFKYIQRRTPSYMTKGARVEEDPWLAQVESEANIQVPSKSMNYLVENVMPGLKKTLVEIATYQPHNAVNYMTFSLLHKNKNAYEMGLDPDPRLIQALVDAQKKKRKSVLKKPDIFFHPMPESTVDLREPSSKSNVKVSSSDEEELSHIARIQRKYKKAKKKMVIEEKEKRKILSTRSTDPGTCLGPTSLPLPVEPPTTIATKR